MALVTHVVCILGAALAYIQYAPRMMRVYDEMNLALPALTISAVKLGNFLALYLIPLSVLLIPTDLIVSYLIARKAALSWFVVWVLVPVLVAWAVLGFMAFMLHLPMTHLLQQINGQM